MPDTWKKRLQTALTDLPKTRKLAEQITDNEIRTDAINDLDGYLEELERLTFAQQIDDEAQATILGAHEELEALHEYFLDHGIISPDP